MKVVSEKGTNKNYSTALFAVQTLVLRSKRKEGGDFSACGVLLLWKMI